MIYTLNMFNTGQVTLPKKWREKFDTSKFVAEETDMGLLIKPISDEGDGVVYYEDDNGFGIYCDKGLDIEKFKAAAKKIHG
ncbi:AbrB/MazE/SpoVT family DNA-binding domain-containing protein [Candidatus Peregrinibacteria bacterium]|jgi:bifunctional DNA-binding transcriptional regulator/antitoxin component of YhaV-PrlF toxin-antitoxin module|nr:AbrB/MazE/SpoVT family DNA-binding domain-containing protein [Candidatus Peregrinibacteria bacterium]MBT4056380.1 AbrB/MazE/SpoVT family DNA-binding domain-containing protein [Candidatus Peregrinibacteria bacterium]